MISVKHSQNQRMEVVADKIVHNIPIDNLAVKRVSVKKHSNQTSTLTPQETTFDKSTKYQTIIHSQNHFN